MSGYAEAVFTCGAMVEKESASGYVYSTPCGETVTTGLYSEYYLWYSEPAGWDIEIDSGGSHVRCPEHRDAP